MLECARDPKHPPRSKPLLDDLAQVQHWDFLCTAAEEHRLAPLLFHWLMRLGHDLVPAEVIERLEGHCRQRSIHQMRLVGFLKTVLLAFQEHQIPVLVLKGPVLGQMVFGNLALRPSNDLDLMVDPNDRERACNLLRTQLGFDVDFLNLDALTPRQRRFYLAHHHEISLGHSGWNLVLDLHWRSSKFELDQFANWRLLHERAQHISLAGLEVPYLDHYDLIVYLAAHGARHAWLRLFWLNDLAALVRGGFVLDWDMLLQVAAGHGQTRALLLGLHLCRLLFGLQLPVAVERLIDKDRNIPAMVERLLKLLFPPVTDPRVFPLELPTLQGVRWLSNLSGNRRQRWRTFTQFFFVPNQRDWQALRLPDAFFPAYYLLRPLRLLVQHGLRLS